MHAFYRRNQRDAKIQGHLRSVNKGRTANLAAHVLAKVEVSNDLEMVWPDVPPDCILDFIANDIPNVVQIIKLGVPLKKPSVLFF